MVSTLARDRRIAKPLRWMVVAGLLPIPGPVDEVVLLLAALALFIFHRASLREAWAREAAGALGSSSR